MRLEFQKIADKEMPTVVAECDRCGGDIPIPEKDFRFSRPLDCGFCHHQRFLSYREFVTFADAIACKLLHMAAIRNLPSDRDRRRS